MVDPHEAPVRESQSSPSIEVKATNEALRARQIPGEPEDAATILAAHRAWLESGGQRGERANFRLWNLRGRSFHNADLRLADLSDAKLHGADLRQCQLEGADISGADFSGALLPGNLASERVAAAGQVSKNAQAMFLSVALACVYTWLTIATTTDAKLLSNWGAISLPIIGTEIPTAAFFIVTPGLLLAAVVFFYSFLRKLWALVASLPAAFPDGGTVADRLDASVLDGVIRRLLLLRQRKQARLAGIGSTIAVFGVVPATLVMLWGRYLACHDWWWTSWHIVLAALAVAVGIDAYGTAAAVVARRPRPKRLKIASSAVVAGALLGVLTSGAIEGVPPRFQKKLTLTERLAPRIWVPQLAQVVGLRTVASFADSDVSTKPPNWDGQPKSLSLVQGARLRRRDLRYVRAWDSFLVNADLRGANLQNAEFPRADLREADLHGADLRRAEFRSADMRGTDLSRTDLADATFVDANLAGADLRCIRSGVRDALDIKKGLNWQLALYPDAWLNVLGLPADHNAKVQQHFNAPGVERPQRHRAFFEIKSDAQCRRDHRTRSSR